MDANSCADDGDVTFTITQPAAALSASSTQTNVNCHGDATGAIALTAANGTAGYTYSWAVSNGGALGNNNATDEDLTNITAGTYVCTITDAAGCTTTETVAITQNNAIVTASSSQTNVNCNGGTTGAAAISVSGGNSTYTYTWSHDANNLSLIHI